MVGSGVFRSRFHHEFHSENAMRALDGAKLLHPFVFLLLLLKDDVSYWLRAKICDRFGHKIECESSVGPDSASEHLSCSRCGFSNDITYY